MEIQREQKTHHCRLCNKPAHDATAEEITARQAEAAELADQVKREVKSRTSLKREVDRLNQEVSELRQRAKDMEAAAQVSLSKAAS